MDRDNTIKRKINPRETSNWLSVVTFFYTIKIFVRGYTVGLELEDIYQIPKKAHSKFLGLLIQDNLKKKLIFPKIPSICQALWLCFWKKFLIIGFIQLITTTIMTTWTPRALSKLISFFSPGQTNITKNDAIFYCCVVIIVNFVNMLVRHNFKLILAGEGIKAKAAIASLLYRKSLKLSVEVLSKITAGKIFTIISKDVDVLEYFFCSGNNLWIAVFQTGVICFLIFRQIGVLSFPGIIFFLIVLPLQIYISILTYNYKLKCSKKSDERLDLIREVLTASKIIKMYTWEKFFEKKILDARREELKELHKSFYTTVWINLIGSMCSKMAFFIFLMTYVWWGKQNISAEIIYYMMTCFGDLESSLSSDIPFGFSQLAQILAAAKRIESVLEAKEIQQTTTTQTNKEPEINFKDVTIEINEKKILENISITIKNKGLYLVVGHTGSGKSIFLKSILQETQSYGDIQINGRLSYASQESWLFPSSIRNNILFGEEFNEERYKKVLRICCLNYDLELLPENDKTIIGESGMNLSKGQQARVSLARAIYRNSDIYLLDDCLASLDASVAVSIFENCFCDFLRDKICLYVTNNAEFIKNVKNLIVVEKKRVAYKDGFDSSKIAKLKDDFEDDIKLSQVTTNKSVYHYETKQSGRVPLRDYLKYLEHGGGIWVFALIISLFVLTQSVVSYSDKVFSRWVTFEQNVTNFKELNETDSLGFDKISKDSEHELGIYTIMVVTAFLLYIVKSFSYFNFVRLASSNVHKTMVKRILNSTMQFFDSHFIGTIINRFTKDFLTVDDTLPFVAMDCFSMIFTASGAIILLTSVNYIFLLESLVLLIMVIIVKQLCQPAGRNLERLHVIARSPLTGHIHSTLEGLITIRASQAQDVITFEFDRHQNLFTSAYIMVVTNFIAINVFVRYVCSIFTSVVILQFLIFDFGSSIGDVGLAITQAFSITSIISTGIICIADCENLMISVERILEYTRLEQEDQSGQILLGWPQAGSILFKDLSLSYGNSTTLHNINMKIEPKEYVGIVGRTGAGKSSLISSLFRLYEPDGQIQIDGVNIKDVSIKWLRSNICVIPQEPYLFSGTIRENLDPLKQYKDEEIWNILKELRLENLIDSLDLKVDQSLNFSAGQKQLLCLARALLKKCKIVVLDEATANVDEEIDSFIEEIVDRHFKENTVFFIAHKLNSILKCNKVVVLSKGRIVEFGCPQELMKNANSFLFQA